MILLNMGFQKKESIAWVGEEKSQPDNKKAIDAVHTKKFKCCLAKAKVVI